MINFHDAQYIISCPSLEFRPKDKYPEVVFLGRSNVGKSTLINALCSQKVAFASKSAGKTQYLNYFLIDKSFYLVDSPGYGFTSYGNRLDESFSDMMESYFHNPCLKGAVILFDARREKLNEDDEMLLRFLKEDKVPFLIVFTKSDVANQSELAKAKRLAESLSSDGIYFSSKGKKLDPVRSAIAKLLG
ncbi:MAG: ribosome biogenesis GTP-binding protein YihA/YsxC [Bacilli bacterium]|jgi:GTP-binding protein|nr:ribosome biogenesis GTP-binding protein YihA/YsxC [Bacilli bacterium]MCH4211143.1 ribosome biogenesis GTP-binding protein YihA/YsxC [Bacilli bacterium]MCH4228309.1 ribosome biogenesis GTP-binding protein YihA/YsxC [Bacilli bacterium]MCH4277342.1 ribosome biogenesis GTP-binding protein YihA/YsxC [Bacilli bacterium]MCI2055334.1 ribosome biogenesis GTP-binding protein YihA/YsxC [Bacilli bacterium]